MEMRPTLLMFLALFCAAAQNDAPLTFDSASIKPNRSGSGSSSSHTRPANVEMVNYSLVQVLTHAYQLKEYQIQAPEWMSSERFDILAKAPFGTPEKALPAMLQTLLAERFKLEAHRETKEFPVYGMVVAKGGFKLKAVEAGGGGMNSNGDEMGGQLKATKTTMERMAQWLSRQVDRPVIDMTGIPGSFDFELKYSRDNAKAESDNTPHYPIVPLAIQEQLGLRLEKRTAPIEILIVDRAEKVPIEN
jgi:uncharacterized protein (TIGR03435 family)